MHIPHEEPKTIQVVGSVILPTRGCPQLYLSFPGSIGDELFRRSRFMAVHVNSYNNLVLVPATTDQHNAYSVRKLGLRYQIHFPAQLAGLSAPVNAHPVHSIIRMGEANVSVVIPLRSLDPKGALSASDAAASKVEAAPKVEKPYVVEALPKKQEGFKVYTLRAAVKLVNDEIKRCAATDSTLLASVDDSGLIVLRRKITKYEEI